MNKALFKNTFRRNIFILMIIFAIMVMYLTIIISMYDPDNTDAMNQMLEALPQEIAAAMGFSTLATDFTSFIAHYYYGFIILMFPMIYCIIMANRLVAKHVDQGSMSFLLSTPNTRRRIVLTQGIFLLLSITILHIAIALLGALVAQVMFPGELDVRSYITINIGAMFLMYSISSISFFFSCLFNESSKSTMFGTGVPVLFFILNMLSNVSAEINWLKNFTIFSLFDVGKILQGETTIIFIVTFYSLTTLILYFAGITIFNKKDLAI
jgi:ABC-2 type transport system permease protein